MYVSRHRVRQNSCRYLNPYLTQYVALFKNKQKTKLGIKFVIINTKYHQIDLVLNKNVKSK